ncbi:MAG: diacylglycerol kinase family protein [Patescibacteria group bacterium]
MKHRHPTLIISFSHAFKGFLLVLKHERNIRIHIIATFVALALGVPLAFTPIEFSLVLIVSGCVIASELFNAALERLSDIVKPRVFGYVAEVKDIAAGAVLFLSLAALCVGLLLYVPKIIDLLLQGSASSGIL